MTLRQHTATINVDLGVGPDMSDVTPELNRLVAAAEIQDGVLAASVVGSTGSITTIEYVQAALLGPSIHLAVRGGRLLLGTWQQVVVLNHDNRPRKRPVAVTVTGV